MRDELTFNLETALEREQSERSPDLAWVLARGRLLRLLRFASVALSVAAVVGVIATVSVALPRGDESPNPVRGDRSPAPQESPPPSTLRNGEVFEEMTDQEKAEVFAFRALADTGLMNPFGERSYNFTYADDTTQTDDGWRIGFAASDCEPRGDTFTCRGLSGDDPELGNALTDTFVTVTLDDRQWRVVDAEGNILDSERKRLIGYTLPQSEEASHWEFPAVGVWPRDEGGWIEMMALWVGSYPTSAPGSICEVQVLDGNDDPLRKPWVFYREPPNRSFERAGGIRGIEIEAGLDVHRAVVDCRQYTGLGWEIASSPEVVGRPGEVTGVTAELVWRGDEGFTMAAVCRATLVDDVGQEVWEGSGRVEPLWRPGELKDYPYRAVAFVPTRGEQVNAEGIGEFSCRSL